MSRRFTRADLVLGLLLLVTLTSLYGTWRTQERLDRVTACTSRITNELVTAVNERTTYTEASAARTTELSLAQRDLITSMLAGKSEVQRRTALNDYLGALDRYEAVQAKARATRKASPYPTVAEVDRCS